MWIKVNIYRAKTNSEALNIRAKEAQSRKKRRTESYLYNLLENAVDDLRSRRETAARVTCIFLRLHPKSCFIFRLKLQEVYLVAQECRWNIVVEVGVEAKCQHFMPQNILMETTKPVGQFATMLHELSHRGKGAKLDHVIQLNCREKCTHASYKTTRIWENFNKWGSKMILFSDELRIIARVFRTE